MILWYLMLLTQQSPNSPTIPREPIRKITSFYPEDPRAPFYDPTGQQMKPLARLYLHRSKIINKSCDAKTEDELLQEISVADNDEDSDRSKYHIFRFLYIINNFLNTVNHINIVQLIQFSSSF